MPSPHAGVAIIDKSCQGRVGAAAWNEPRVCGVKTSGAQHGRTAPKEVRMAALAARNWAAIAAYVGVGLAILALLALAVGPLGWRLGWWHFRFAFFWLMPWAAYGALAAAAVSILALVFGWSYHGARGLRDVHSFLAGRSSDLGPMP